MKSSEIVPSVFYFLCFSHRFSFGILTRKVVSIPKLLLSHSPSWPLILSSWHTEDACVGHAPFHTVSWHLYLICRKLIVVSKHIKPVTGHSWKQSLSSSSVGMEQKTNSHAQSCTGGIPMAESRQPWTTEWQQGGSTQLPRWNLFQGCGSLKESTI